MSGYEFIYALCDENGFVRYVGRSANPWKRVSHHESRYSSVSLREWINSLREHGRRPTVIVLRQCSTSEAEACEHEFIRLIGSNSELLNCHNTIRPSGRRRENKRTLGHNLLREALKQRSIDQKRFAKMIGIEESLVSRLLRGYTNPGLRAAVRIESALGIPTTSWTEAA